MKKSYWLTGLLSGALFSAAVLCATNASSQWSATLKMEGGNDSKPAYWIRQDGNQQAQSVVVKPEDDVLATQRQFVAATANKDVAALKRIVAEDFVGVGPGGHTAAKSAMLGPFPEGPTSFAFVKMEDPIARIFDGSTAVVLGELNNFDVDRHETVRFAMVYRKRANGWELVAGQLVPRPAE